jgi:uncharacterized protein YdeI (YjbR/CyaY-like superfamily)
MCYSYDSQNVRETFKVSLTCYSYDSQNVNVFLNFKNFTNKVIISDKSKLTKKKDINRRPLSITPPKTHNVRFNALKQCVNASKQRINA